MSALRKTALAFAILLALWAAYIGAYWFARKSEIGNEFFSSAESSWQKWPAWMRRAEMKLFLPARDMEHWLGEYRQRRHLPGEWISKSGKEQVRIDANLTVTFSGFLDRGFPDGSWDKTSWGHWGTARAYLIVGNPGTKSSLQVFVPDDDKDELFINHDGPDDRGGLGLRRKGTPIP